MSTFSLFSDPHARHAIITHWPIVMCAVLPLLVLLVAFTKGKNKTLIYVALGASIVACASAFMAEQSGEAAEFSLNARYQPISAAEAAALHEHEELGEGGWLWPLIPMAFLGVLTVPTKRSMTRWVLIAMALLGSVAGVVWVSMTAHAGGKLVYVHGLGVPERVK
ncbi:MAG: hypothetical protein ACKVZJ_11175 [Phycisphaerales bacterium]